MADSQFLGSLIQSLKEVIGGLPKVTVNKDGGGREAPASEEKGRRSEQPRGPEEGKLSAEGETASDDPKQAKHLRGERQVQLFDPFLEGLGGRLVWG